MMSKPFTDGWRGRIGLVATAPGNATEADFNRYRPGGVAVLTTRTPLTSSTPEGIRQMNRYVEDAVALLAGNAFCDVVLCSSTAGSFLEGREADLAMTQRLSQQNNCKVITSADCMLQALSAVGADSVTLISPSSRALIRVECDFLEQAGIRVSALGGFHLSSPRDILAIQPSEVTELVRRTDCPDSGAILLSCSGLHVMELIDSLEQEFGKPVLASNQFGLWGCLRTLGISQPISGLGSLWQH